MTVDELLQRKRVGMILRVFAEDYGEALQRASAVYECADRIKKIHDHFGKKLISRIDVLVCQSSGFEPGDYGGSLALLRGWAAMEVELKVAVHNIQYGDPYCEALNWGVAYQLRKRIDYSLIFSHEAYPLLTGTIVHGLIDGMAKFLLVAGVAFDDYIQWVNWGFIRNTCAIWNNIALLQVGGFDHNAIPGVQDRGGVEEIAPLLRLRNTFGGCIARVLSVASQAKPIIDKPINPKYEADKKGFWDTKRRLRMKALGAIDDDLREVVAENLRVII